MYDLIGDIHGHAATLEVLLEAMGYSRIGGVYTHPERTAVFLGDFVDRGPLIRETLALVRPMVEQGHALAVMGNHEFNTLSYHIRHRQTGEWLRRHNEGNTRQQRETEEAFAAAPDELAAALEWFWTLPLFLELTDRGGHKLRVIHACWSDSHLQELKALLPDHRLTLGFLEAASHWQDPRSPECELVETLLKGPEIELEDGLFYLDKGGLHRSSIRLKWWGPFPEHPTWGDIALSLPENATFKDLPVSDKTLASLAQMLHYPKSDPPVFFGHYWLRGIPALLQSNLSCLDYSVADRKAHPSHRQLVAYRWQDEQTLDPEHFVAIELQEEP